MLSSLAETADPLLILDPSLSGPTLEKVLASSFKTLADFQKEVIDRLQLFCAALRDPLVHALLTPSRSGEGLRLVIATGEPYDFDAGQLLAEEDLRFSDQGWHRFQSLQLPGSPTQAELRQFLAYAQEEEATGG